MTLRRRYLSQRHRPTSVHDFAANIWSVQPAGRTTVETDNQTMNFGLIDAGTTGRVGARHTFDHVETLTSHVAKIDHALANYTADGRAIVMSSSFQTHSIAMLHLVSRSQPGIPVAFLDTGFHFDETIAFRDQVAEQLDLDLIVLTGNTNQRPDLYVTSETQCCNVNKVEPLHDLLAGFDVWISGVRADQTSNRRAFASVMAGPADTLRYHPMLSWSAVEIDTYRFEFDLPAHPLDERGYRSIGCRPCTSVPVGADDRSGRWSSTEKTECGLHLTLVDR